MFGIEQAFAATGGEGLLAAGLIAGGAMTILLMGVVFVVLLIIARWKIFTKAGEAGWKSIIPIYSDYVQWRISWKKTFLFWVVLALVVVGSVIMSMGGSYSFDASGTMVVNSAADPFLSGLGEGFFLVAFIIELVCIYKMMVSFGHGAGWLVLYIFFPNIMLLVLGFGSSTYRGPQD